MVEVFENFWNGLKITFCLICVFNIVNLKGETTTPILQKVTIESDRKASSQHKNQNYTIPKSEALSGNFENLSDVSIIATEGKIKSICVQAGLWAIFYSDNYLNVGAILYTSGLPDDRACTNEAHRNGTNPQYKSIRHIGNRELSRAGISFYLGPFFTREELYFDGRKLNLNQPIKTRSFGFTGKENWTVFEESDFKGSTSCLLSAYTGNPAYYTVVYNKDANLTVGSLQRGCGGQRSSEEQSVLILPTGEVKVGGDLATDIEPASASTLLLKEISTNQNPQQVSGANQSVSKIFTDGDELRIPKSQTLTVEYVIGGNSSWTVFSHTNFEGRGRCFSPKLLTPNASDLDPGSVTPGTESTTLESTTVTLQIGSIKRGCFPESRREPRVFNQPKTVEEFQRPSRPFDSYPANRIFFTSFLIALAFLILIILLAIFTISYFYCRRKRQ